METTEIKKTLVEAYQNESQENKNFLEKLLGAEFFKIPVIEQKLSFEDICAQRGDNPIDIIPYSEPKNKRQKYLNDIAMLDYIAEFLQQGYVADYGNSNEQKWFPYFNYNTETSGFGFSYSLCDCSSAIALCGSRLALPTEELSNYFGTQFIEIHNRLLTNNY